LAACPRWPEEFWGDSLDRGGGGTCFESNYAFFSLLLALGYKGYLTINNMGDSVGCHAAIILDLNGRSWLVDAGMPLYVPIPIDAAGLTSRESRFHRYTVYPDGLGRFQVERDRHPKPNCFTLIDKPVSNQAYRATMVADYRLEGYFLDRLIITKVVGDEVWRFNSDDKPFRIERFSSNGKAEDFLNDQDTIAVAEEIAIRFEMDGEIVGRALMAVL
jgi:hypothetical protein